MEPDISGAWLSKNQRVYIITQVGNKFVWRVAHENGVIETGIGSFLDKNEVEATWNFDGGKIETTIKSSRGKVRTENGKPIKILWDDMDHFEKKLG